MKTLTLLIIGAFIASAMASDEITKNVKTDAKTLAELLTENWDVQAKEDEITLTSKFEVFFIAMVSRGSSPPEFSDKVPREELLAETKPGKYVIRLHYQERLSNEVLQHRIGDRRKAADVLHAGTAKKSDFSKLNKLFEAIKVPRYDNDICHIYETLPDSTYAQAYPPLAVQKIGGAKEILTRVLQKIPDIND